MTGSRNSMKPKHTGILTVNGGSSSIKFALFEASGSLRRILTGRIEGVGLPQGGFAVHSADTGENFSRAVTVPDHTAAVNLLMDWIEERFARSELAAVGHRVVHGGPKYWEPQRITAEMVESLHQLSPFDPEHLPEEILLTEAFHCRFPHLPQFACFDTAFHHDLPRVARLLPIPRRYDAKGVQRYGFHGLSCEYLMEELARVAGVEAANGRVILAHLGNGASITAGRQHVSRRHLQRTLSELVAGRGRHETAVHTIFISRRHSQSRRAGNAGFHPRRRRIGIRAVARLRRGV